MPDIKSVSSVLHEYNLTPPSHMEMIVNSIATDYQNGTEAWANSRRITGIIDDLKAINHAASNLGVILKNLHPQTFQAMGGDWELPGQLTPDELDETIKKSVLEDLSTNNKDRERKGILKDIFDLAKLSSSSAQALHDTWILRRNDGKLDPGGNKTIASMTSDHPKTILARSCKAILVQDYKVEITSSQNGLFYKFFAAVYEFASNEGSEEKGAGLERYAKQVVNEKR
jgi:hypothetical protein